MGEESGNYMAPGAMRGSTPLLTFGVTSDNRNTHPTVTSNDNGGRTEWSLEDLDAAVKWLRTHADFLGRVRARMLEIPELIDGPASAGSNTSTLGSFPKALELKTTHKQLYDSTKTGIEALFETLHDTADALEKINKEYEKTEKKNALTAQDWTKILGEQSNAPDHDRPDATVPVGERSDPR